MLDIEIFIKQLFNLLFTKNAILWTLTFKQFVLMPMGN